MLSNEDVVAALEAADPPLTFQNGRISELVERANHELCSWGHDDHQITLERVSPFFGDPQILSWSFWCETCHVSQLALLAMPTPV
jgi:hypothetical protein